MLIVVLRIKIEYQNFSINTKIAETIIDKIGDATKFALSTIVPIIGAEAAAETIGAGALNLSARLSPLQYAAFLG